MLTFAIATSIDALAAGLTLAAVDANVWLAILLIGVITFVASFVGAFLGAKIGGKGKTGLHAVGHEYLVYEFKNGKLYVVPVEAPKADEAEVPELKRA